MGNISETYASPQLRLGLLLVDHPGSSHSCEMRVGTEVGVPRAYGGEGNFCVCTLLIPGHEPIVAYKAIKDHGNADEWQVNSTKTLGRALKKAGYPDDLKDLKALVLWRQREAEIDLIRGGHPAALERVNAPLEIESSGQDSDDDDPPDSDTDPDVIDVVEEPPTKISQNSAQGSLPADDRIEDAEVVEDSNPADEMSERDEQWAESLLVTIKSMPDDDKTSFKAFLAEQEIPRHPNDWLNDHLKIIDRWLDGEE